MTFSSEVLAKFLLKYPRFFVRAGYEIPRLPLTPVNPRSQPKWKNPPICNENILRHQGFTPKTEVCFASLSKRYESSNAYAQRNPEQLKVWVVFTLGYVKRTADVYESLSPEECGNLVEPRNYNNLDYDMACRNAYFDASWYAFRRLEYVTSSWFIPLFGVDSDGENEFEDGSDGWDWWNNNDDDEPSCGDRSSWAIAQINA